MAHILEGVKLPERKEFRAAADASQPTPPAAETPQQEIAPEPSVPPVKEGVAAVHTLKDDLQMAAQDNHLSLVQAAALEQTKKAHQGHEKTPEQFRQPRMRSFGPLMVSALLVFLGLLALGAVYMIIRDRSGLSNSSTFIVEGLLFAEQTIPFPVHDRSSTELKRLLAEARGSSGTSLGVITRIVPLMEDTDKETKAVSERPATTAEFFDALGVHAPEELLRALDNEFFFGFHTVDENAPLLVIPVASYERAFAGMLTWEKSINGDLAPVFTAVPPLGYNAEGLLIKRAFEDSIMRNFDVRELKDDAGVVQLYYSFPTRNLLIISESPYSFAEILARLRAKRAL